MKPNRQKLQPTSRTPRRRQQVDTGPVTLDPIVTDLVDPIDVDIALAAHRRRNWGDVDTEEWRANDRAFHTGFGTIISFHDTSVRGRDLRIVTSQHPRATTEVHLVVTDVFDALEQKIEKLNAERGGDPFLEAALRKLRASRTSNSKDEVL